MINHRNKQNYRFRTWKIRDRCHLKGGVRQGCFQSLILNYLIQYIHFHSLYITSHYHAKFKENSCVGTDARPPFNIHQKVKNLNRRHIRYCLIWFCTVCLNARLIWVKQYKNFGYACPSILIMTQNFLLTMKTPNFESSKLKQNNNTKKKQQT